MEIKKIRIQWTTYALTAALIIFSLLIHLRLQAYADDDAYIHYRIAENFASAGLPYFNLDEAVMASSSSVWTCLLALLAFLGLSLPRAVAVLNAIITAAGALVYSTYIRKDFQIRSGLFVFIYLALVLPTSVGLMETPLGLLLVGIGFLLYSNRRPYAFLFWSTAIFVRLELCIVLGVMWVHSLITCRANWKKNLLFTCIGALPFVAYDLYYFGTLIPNTVVAKSVLYSLRWIDTMVAIARGFFPVLSKASPYLISASFFYFVSLIFLTWVYGIKNQSYGRVFLLKVLPFWSIGALIAASYLFRKTFLFEWYLPLMTVPVAVAIFCTGLHHPHKISVTMLAFFVVPLLAYLGIQLKSTATQASHLNFEGGARVRKYIEVGERLYKQYPNATLLSSEIGGLSFGFKGKIADAAGLASPSAIKYHPMEIPEERSSRYLGAIPVGYVREVNPDIIVSYPVNMEDLEDDPALQYYNRIEEPIFTVEDMLLYPEDKFWFGDHLNIFIQKNLDSALFVNSYHRK